MGLLTIEKYEVLYVTKQQPQKANNYTVANFVEPKKSFLQSVVETVTMEEIFTPSCNELGSNRNKYYPLIFLDLRRKRLKEDYVGWHKR